MTSTWRELVQACCFTRTLSNTDLDRTTIDEQTIQLGVGLASTIGMVEGDLGNAAAGTTRAIRQLDFLDLADRGLEVFLSRRWG